MENNEFMEKLHKEYLPVKDNLIQMLNEVQEHYGYVPKDAQQDLSEYLGIPMAEIYGVITFYSRFSLKPKGKYNISVCMGTACFVKGSQKILDRLIDTPSSANFSIKPTFTILLYADERITVIAAFSNSSFWVLLDLVTKSSVIVSNSSLVIVPEPEQGASNNTLLNFMNSFNLVASSNIIL